MDLATTDLEVETFHDRRFGDGNLEVLKGEDGFGRRLFHGPMVPCTLVTSVMPSVTFLGSDGQIIKKVDAETGRTVLSIALDNGIPMESACGGNGFCTTCMCNVQEGMPNLSARNEREENMGVMDDPFRLSCQSEVNGDVTVKLIDV